jgi:hypothetical protein
MRYNDSMSFVRSKTGIAVILFITAFAFLYLFTGVFGGTSIGVTLRTNQNVASGLVAHYTFDGEDVNTGSSTAEIGDASGNDNTGDWKSHASTTLLGVIGQGVSLDGTDDYIEVEDSSSLDVTNVTISVWIKSDGNGGYIVSKEEQ